MLELPAAVARPTSTPRHQSPRSAGRVRRLYEALHDAIGESIRYGRVPDGVRRLTRVRDDRELRCHNAPAIIV